MRSQLTKDINQYCGLAKVRKKAVRIYAEGDSWFDYPGGDILTEVYDQATKVKRKPIILKRSVGGDEATQMLSGSQRHKIVQDFSIMSRKKLHPDVILLSAGGNDLVGMYDFPMMIKKAADNSPVSSFLNERHLALRLHQIGLCYLEMSYFRDLYFPSTPIVTHQYDQAIPSNRGVEVLGLTLIKSWMKPYMDGISIKSSDQQKISIEIMRRYAELLTSLKSGTFSIDTHASISIGNFHIAPTSGILLKNEWENEIHPNDIGFEKITKVILTCIRSINLDLENRI